MNALSHVTMRALFTRELVSLRTPVGPDRRKGAVSHARALMASISEELETIDDEHRQKRLGIAEAAAAVTDLALEMTSFLYAAGAPHEVWRRWASLSAYGSYLAGEGHVALRYAAMSGEWAFLARLAIEKPASPQLVDQVLWQLIGGAADAPLPLHADDGYAQAWLTLGVSIPAMDHLRTEEALACLADDWMDATDGEWRDYGFRSFPMFEPPICAAGALARRSTFVAHDLTPDQLSVLEAGLAETVPDPMYPDLWRIDR